MATEPGDEVHDAEGARLAAVRPSARQLRWQAMEAYAFVHFGMNTMTDREWGLGHEDPGLFDPVALDVGQWVAAIASAGMTGLIITAKHHDGFCLWPSRVSRHTVAASPWRDGGGDLLRELADAVASSGLRLGIYLSPWDRTEATWGSGRAYDDFFVAQLEEVLTDYGPVFSVWFDGANGEGPDGRVQQYDWDRYTATIRRLQPDAVISVCGPDVRWCGNEAGHVRPDEWSVVPAALQDVERIADASQQADDGTFSRLVRSDAEDLGSRAALAGVDDLVWYPAEVNTSIRPGWFHHPAEDDLVRSADELFALWEGAVGGNAALLLNVPPDARGLVADPDLAALRGLGERVAAFRARSLPVRIETGPVPSDRRSPGAAEPLPATTLHLDRPAAVEAVVLRERIELGQRVERVRVVGVLPDGSERPLAESGAVGAQRIVRVPPTVLAAVRVEVQASRAEPRFGRIEVVGASAGLGSSTDGPQTEGADWRWPDLHDGQRLVLRDVLIHGSRSRAELARRTGLSRTSLTRLTRDLVDLGFLREGDVRPLVGRGRPSETLDLRPESAHFAGVNLTGDALHAVVTDLHATVLEQTEHPLPDPGDVSGVVDLIGRVVDGFRDRHPRLAAAGLCLAGDVVLVDGAAEVEHSDFLGWPRTPLQRLVQDRTGLPVVVSNDVQSLAAGHHWFGAGVGCSSFAVVSFGAGIGAGLVVHDEPVRGAHGRPGRVSHVRMGGERPEIASVRCGLGHRDCVSAWATGPALLRNSGARTVDEALRLAAEGEPTAVLALEGAGEALGAVVATVVDLVDPQLVVLTGEGLPVARAAHEALHASLAARLDPVPAPGALQLRDFAFADYAWAAAISAIRRVLQPQSG